MARTPSNMIRLGTVMPEFELPDVRTGILFRSADISPATVVCVSFICNHCPYVKHILEGFLEMTKKFDPDFVPFVFISSNDAIAYPEDSPEQMKRLAAEKNFQFPYLYDESQEVARIFQAACTPDFFLFDKSGKLAYRGQMDDSRPGNNIPVSGDDLSAAIEALSEGKDVSAIQKPSIGCNIKWKVE
ncbi:MAG: thioredoxin family protein [Bacteroidetes bacterium]|nr:MAG: thioredoxin family protein [Bacteroidota bacterium]